MTLFKNYPMSPVKGLLDHPLWLLDEELKYLGDDDKDVKAVLNNWTKQLCTWTIHDFHTLYSDNDCKPIFSAGYSDIDTYYYDVEESLRIMDELITFQNNDDEEAKLAFLSDLFNVLERKLPKLNSLLVHSPPSAGKNFFFDAIRDYYINVGHMSKLNKFVSFCTQDTNGRRLIFFNEPNYSDDYIETLKLLFGGDSTNVSVKYKEEKPVYRTPVICLTNNVISVMSDVAFRDRLRVYHWRTAPFLRHYLKKPHPLATFKLFEKYNLV